MDATSERGYASDATGAPPPLEGEGGESILKEREGSLSVEGGRGGYLEGGGGAPVASLAYPRSLVASSFALLIDVSDFRLISYSVNALKTLEVDKISSIVGVTASEITPLN